MKLIEIGSKVRERREALGLTQQQLGKLSGLSRSTINQLEMGTLNDLGVSKLLILLGILNLNLETTPSPLRSGLKMASRTASVSYRTPLGVDELSMALISGDLPKSLWAQISTLIDEAPVSILASAVEEAAAKGKVPPKAIWKNIRRWAAELHSPRTIWA